MRLGTLVFFLILNMLPCVSLADATRNFYSQQAMERFTKLPQNARTLGTAGSSIQTTSDSSSILGNPAGLGRMQVAEFSLSAGQGNLKGKEFIDQTDFEQYENTGQGFLAVPMAQNTELGTKLGTFAIGLSRYDGTSDDSINTRPDGHLRTLAYGIAPTDYLSVGYSFSFVDDQLRTDLTDYHSHARFIHLIGIQIIDRKDMTLGVTYGFLNGQNDYEEFSIKSNELTKSRQQRISLGIQKVLGNFTLSGSADFDKYESKGDITPNSPRVIIGNREEGETISGHLGVDHRTLGWLSLRAGYRYTEVLEYEFSRKDLEQLSGAYDYSAFAGGASLHLTRNDNSNLDYFRIDYAGEFRTLSGGDFTQIISLVIPIVI